MESSTMPFGWLITIIIFLFGILLAIIGFFTARTVNQVDVVAKTSNDNALAIQQSHTALANYRTEASEKFATRADTLHALDRIHERMDTMTKASEESFREIGQNVMSIMTNIGVKGKKS